MTVAELRRRYEAGQSATKLSNLTGMSRRTVLRVLQRAGAHLRTIRQAKSLSGRMAPARRRALLRRICDLYYDRRLPLAEVGPLVGLSHERVRQLMAEDDLPRRAQGQHARYSVAIEAARRSGASVEEAVRSVARAAETKGSPETEETPPRGCGGQEGLE